MHYSEYNVKCECQRYFMTENVMYAIFVDTYPSIPQMRTFLA